ncbi:hypothetical protein PhageC_00001 [Pseudomonas phage C_MDJ-2023]|nr:hypothetical protein PhageC_00001 [Pseudomonas phage C_MDJ-2023]
MGVGMDGVVTGAVKLLSMAEPERNAPAFAKALIWSWTTA